MSRKNWLITGVICLLTNTAASAQTCELDQISSQIDSTRSFDFVQEKYIPALSRPLKSSGRLRMDGNGELTWQLQSPIASTLVISPTGIRQYNDKGELTMSNQNALFLDLSSLFLTVFNGNLDALQESFDTEANCAENGEWTLSLTPRNASLAKVLTHLELGGNTSLNFIAYEEQRGDRTSIHLTPYTDTPQVDSFE